MQACLGMFHVGTLATCSKSSNMQSWPPYAKISHSLNEQNPSFQNWPKNWFLIYGTKLEGLPRTIPMSWIQQSQQFIDLSNDHHSIAHWIPPPTGFQGHLLNPYPGHRMETMHQNGLSRGHASMFRKVPCGNDSHMFTVKEYPKLTPMCKKLAFPYRANYGFYGLEWKIWFTVQTWVNRIGYRVCKLGLETVIRLRSPFLNVTTPMEKHIIRVKEIIIGFKKMSL